jgi:hypothetical protein
MTAMSKEAHARIKINKLLEGSGWRFFDDFRNDARLKGGPNVNPGMTNWLRCLLRLAL